MSIICWTSSLAVLSLFAAGTTVAATVSEKSPLPAQVRAANDRFKHVAVAVAEGHAPTLCASGADGAALGAHYVKSSLIGAAVDIKQPQAIMYEPKADGKMERIAAEYITTKGPASLGGQLFNFTGSPNRYGLPPFYELQVWAWKSTSRGAYADMNPSVSCEHAHALKQTASPCAPRWRRQPRCASHLLLFDDDSERRWREYS